VTIPPIEAPPVSYREQVLASSREQFTAVRAGVEKIIVEELSASAASESPFDARMKKRPVPVTPRPVPIHRPVIREQVKTFVPRPPTPLPARPPVPTKSAEDLKTILRNMTAKSGAEKEKKQEQSQRSLRGALSEALKPVAVEPPQGEKRPFEVSEDKLRDVLKGDI
ncbi:MAG: hypothetical protein AAB555_02515, partial [Patescibacteria group bacterium]